jgi:hypothetical protein
MRSPFSFIDFSPTMRRSLRVFLSLLLIGFLLVPSTTQAQVPSNQNSLDGFGDLRAALQSATGAYADRYVQPLTDTFGANMNGGLFRTADVGNGFIPGLPFNVYLGVSVSGTFSSSLNKSFTLEEGIPVDTRLPQTSAEIVLNGEARTVAGKTTPPDATLELVFRQNGQVRRREQLGQALQGLLDEDVPVLPLPVPQLGLGSVAGTDVQVRYFPKTEICYGGGCYGEIGLFGLAVRHDIDQWIPAPLPLNLAVQGAWNQFSLANSFQGATEEVLDASGWALNVQASKGIPVVPIVLYGGLQYETFNVEYDYRFDLGRPDIPPVDVSLDQTAANRVRGIAGFSLDLALIRFNVDYAVGGSNNVLTTGLGIRL